MPHVNATIPPVGVGQVIVDGTDVGPHLAGFEVVAAPGQATTVVLHLSADATVEVDGEVTTTVAPDAQALHAVAGQVRQLDADTIMQEAMRGHEFGAPLAQAWLDAVADGLEGEAP